MKVTIKKPFHVVRHDPTGKTIPTQIVLPMDHCPVRHEPPVVYLDFPTLGAYALTEEEFDRHLHAGDIEMIEPKS